MIYSTKKGTGLPVPNYIQLLKIDKNSYKFIWSFKCIYDYPLGYSNNWAIRACI